MKRYPLLMFLSALLLPALAAFSALNTDRNAMHGPDASAATYDGFVLSYYMAGLGSNRGDKLPVLRVKGLKYEYTREQNSDWGFDRDTTVDKVCSGTLRPASVDSIIDIFSTVKDTVVFNGSDILSGAFLTVSITYQGKKLRYELLNNTEPNAAKIIAILNSNLPSGIEKLWDGKFD